VHGKGGVDSGRVGGEQPVDLVGEIDGDVVDDRPRSRDHVRVPGELKRR
jgi:hypothetical protein